MDSVLYIAIANNIGLLVLCLWQAELTFIRK